MMSAMEALKFADIAAPSTTRPSSCTEKCLQLAAKSSPSTASCTAALNTCLAPRRSMAMPAGSSARQPANACPESSSPTWALLSTRKGAKGT